MNYKHLIFGVFIGFVLVCIIVYMDVNSNNIINQNITQVTPNVKTLGDKIITPVKNTTEQEQSTQASEETNVILDPRQISLEVHKLINTERKDRGLSEIGYNIDLSTIAQAHSSDMLVNHYFNHTDLQGHDPAYRYQQNGFTCNGNIGENIAEVWGYNTPEEAAKTIVSGWMNSTEHRDNILFPSFTIEGVGISNIGTDVFATEDFC